MTGDIPSSILAEAIRKLKFSVILALESEEETVLNNEIWHSGQTYTHSGKSYYWDFKAQQLVPTGLVPTGSQVVVVTGITGPGEPVTVDPATGYMVTTATATNSTFGWVQHFENFDPNWESKTASMATAGSLDVRLSAACTCGGLQPVQYNGLGYKWVAYTCGCSTVTVPEKPMPHSFEGTVCGRMEISE
jgi:hypothetical protein